ncbi:MAG: type II secretion system F family protein, partial [Patescibacteria group bacterium]
MDFNYVARNRQGEMQAGVVAAADRKAAVEMLQGHGLFIVDLRPGGKGFDFVLNIKLFQRVKSKDLTNFSRQMATLVSAQVPLLASLQSVAKQTGNDFFKTIILEVARDIESGTLFSKALARHKGIFSTFYINMVRAGEASGNLENTLNYLADYLEKQYYLNAKVRGALAYPGFIISVFILIATLMMTLVVPKLTSFLSETGQELPFVTMLMINISDFLRSYWWLLFTAIFGGLVYAFYAVKTSPAARRNWDVLKLKIPILGERIFQKIYVARLAESLSTLIKGGLSILQALQVTSEVIGNVVYQEIILEAKENVRVGNTLSSAFEKYREIPPLVTQMIVTGEQSGSLDVILKKMS